MAETEQSGRPRSGRTPAITHSRLGQTALELFLEHGFDQTTIDDIVSEAEIGRRTLFRYFKTKNDLPWGNFATLLEGMRANLARMDHSRPLFEVLKETIIAFNDFPPAEKAMHRKRMEMIFTVPTLMAHSTLRYADWREVIAEYVALRRGELASDLTPQTIAWVCLGICLSAYEQWLAHDHADLTDLLDSAFSAADELFSVDAQPPSHSTSHE